MIYRFDAFELDVGRFELRHAGSPRALEPQVFALLALLIENRDRLVTKDEIIEKIWDGRVVTDATLASRVKSARRALGDDGVSQRYIRTVHRRGLRFVADARASAGLTNMPDTAAHAPAHDRAARPSIAVLPFAVAGDAGVFQPLAHALPHELITGLSRLRWLFVIARGSSFRIPPTEADYGEVGRLLGVRYCLAGTLEVDGRRLAIDVQLIDTRDGGVVWAERFARPVDDVHAIREEIGARVLAALEIRIPLHEAELARHVVPGNLDAWSAYHVGLQHMYRYNRVDNAKASALFGRAVALEPGFARAHAGLSFLHFQTAFMRHTDDIDGEIAAARRCAERGLELDALDPFVNFTMGRSFWLAGDLDESLVWLERATLVNPNYAEGIYARAWTEALADKASAGRQHVDLAMRLSPLDPLYYAMLGTRSLIHITNGEDNEAAAWSERAARSPGAHVLIAMIAAAAHGLSGDTGRATYWAANVRERDPALTRADFFRSFPMKQQAARARVSQVLGNAGF